MNNALTRVSNEGKVGMLLKDAYEDVRFKKHMKKAKIPAKEIDLPSNNIFTNSIDQNDGIQSELISIYETDKSIDRSTDRK